MPRRPAHRPPYPLGSSLRVSFARRGRWMGRFLPAILQNSFVESAGWGPGGLQSSSILLFSLIALLRGLAEQRRSSAGERPAPHPLRPRVTRIARADRKGLSGAGTHKYSRWRHKRTSSQLSSLDPPSRKQPAPLNQRRVCTGPRLRPLTTPYECGTWADATPIVVSRSRSVPQLEREFPFISRTFVIAPPLPLLFDSPSSFVP